MQRQSIPKEFTRLWIWCRLGVAAALLATGGQLFLHAPRPVGSASLLIELILAAYLLISSPFLRLPSWRFLLLGGDCLAAVTVNILSPSALAPFMAAPPLMTGALLFPARALIGLSLFLTPALLVARLHHLPPGGVSHDFWPASAAILICVAAAFQTQGHRERKSERDVLINLIRVSQELGSTLDLEKVSDIVLQITCALLNAHTVGFYVITRDGDRAILHLQRIVTPYNRWFTDLAYDVNQKSALLEAVKERKTLLIGDLHATEEAVIPKIQVFHSLLVTPIIFENEPLGAIFLIQAAANAYTPEHAELLNMLANQIAICLKNVHLYQTTSQMAITDSLTGLFSHGYFQENLVKTILSSKYDASHFSLAIIDVDFFKQVNDTYGHPQGDYLLRQLAGLVKQNVRKADLVARYGGDEFTISMPGLDRMSAAVAAERIRQEVEEYQFVAGARVVKVTISIGVASFPESAQTSKDLVAAADQALYDSKHRGRNQVAYR